MEGGLCLAFNCRLPLPSSNDRSFSIPLPRTTRINAELNELRVCTNRTCRRQGSMQILETFSSLAPPSVAVKPCGCLGRCGAGPNLVALPDGVVIRHCGTPARAAEILMTLCGIKSGGPDAVKSLEAIALRKRAETEFQETNFEEAERLLSQAIELRPFGGIHVLYKDRCLARLAMGNCSAALQDAREALELSPNYTEAYICEGETFMAMDQYDAAEKSYSACLKIDPSIRRSKSFKTRIVKLQEKLTAANKC